jgi:hypothetical protein
MSKNPLVEGIDYYINKQGLLVFTETYHLKRGHCCQSGCLHCPYKYSKDADPNTPAEFSSSWSEEEVPFETEEENDD